MIRNVETASPDFQIILPGERNIEFMKRFFDWLTRPDDFGDSPLSLAAGAAVFLLMLAALFHMPGY